MLAEVGYNGFARRHMFQCIKWAYARTITTKKYHPDCAYSNRLSRKYEIPIEHELNYDCNSFCVMYRNSRLVFLFALKMLVDCQFEWTVWSRNTPFQRILEYEIGSKVCSGILSKKYYHFRSCDSILLCFRMNHMVHPKLRKK